MRGVARQLSQQSWGVVQQVASVWTLARRRATDELLFTALREGTARAAKAILDSGVLLRPKKGRKASAAAAKAAPKSSNRSKESSAQFFLTEFDDGGSSLGEGSDTAMGQQGEDSDSGKEFYSSLSCASFTSYNPCCARCVRLSEEFLPSPTRGSVRFFNKDRTSLEDLTASALAALRLSKRQRPAKTYDPAIQEHK